MTLEYRTEILRGLFTYFGKVLNKLFTAQSHDSGVPIPVLYDISLISLFQDIPIFVNAACKKNEDIDKNCYA